MAHEGEMVCRRPLGNDEELRILLIGKSGDGKSATGNMILGFEAFKASSSANSVTDVCRFEYGERFGRKLMVVDTPGLCDTKRADIEIKIELMRSLGFTTPGFHVIIYVLFAGRFTKECSETKSLFFEWFGSNVDKHAMIILTNWSEKKKGHPLKHFEENNELGDFLESCGNRVVGFNNDSEDEAEKNEQVKKMLSVIDKIIKENNNTYFTTFAFQLVQKCIQLDELPVFRWLRNRIFSAVDKTHEEKEQCGTENKVKHLVSQYHQRDASFNGSTSLRNPPDMDANAPPDVCTTVKNKQVELLSSAKEVGENIDMKQVSSEAKQQLVTIRPNQIYGTPHDDVAESESEQVAINKVKRLASDFENKLLQQRDCTLQDVRTTVKEEKKVDVRAWSNRPKESTDTKQDAPKTQRQPMTFQSNQVDGTPFDVCHAAKENEQLSINKVKRLASDSENTLLQQRDGTLHDFYTTTKEKEPVKFLASSEEAKEKHVMKQDALVSRQQMTIQSNQNNGSSLDVSTTENENKEAKILMSSDEVKENPLPYVCTTAEETQQVEDLLQNDEDVNKSKKDDKAIGNMVLDNSKKDYKVTRNKFFDNLFVKRIMKIYDFFTGFILRKKIPQQAITDDKSAAAASASASAASAAS